MPQLLSRQERKLIARKAGVPFEPVPRYVGRGLQRRNGSLHQVNPALIIHKK